MLKTSNRNWAPYRSLNLKFLNTERSTFTSPESRKIFRPMLPNVPNAGGVRNELRFVDGMQQPACSVAPETEWLVHPAIALVESDVERGTLPYTVAMKHETPACAGLRVPS